MCTAFTTLERAVLQATLAGPHPALARLRKQLDVAEVKSRRHTGVGFFTEMTVAEAPDLAISVTRAVFGDVVAEFPGVPHGAGFLIFVERGFISMLEGFVYEGSWPADESQFAIGYVNGAHDPNSFRLA